VGLNDPESHNRKICAKRSIEVFLHLPLRMANFKRAFRQDPNANISARRGILHAPITKLGEAFTLFRTIAGVRGMMASLLQ
jgi:hypothetical protein